MSFLGMNSFQQLIVFNSKIKNNNNHFTAKDQVKIKSLNKHSLQS